ncbi:cell cycle serine/threonine-protein kinase CDC5/MSD2, partial [Planoprotostelium fungivorum]
ATERPHWPEDVRVSDDAKRLVEWMLDLDPLSRPTVRDVLRHRWWKKPLPLFCRRWSSGKI